MTDTLKLALLLMHLVGHLDEASFHGIKSDFVLVKTPYTFPGNASSCERAEWRKSFPTAATIARKYQNQNCLIEKGFLEEFTCKENHLLLNSAKYTDLGLYVFVCDEVTDSLKLDVLDALNVDVAEMDNITLKCYAVSANDVMWLHNNESVLYYKKDVSMNTGKGYEGRVSLEQNCFKTGDLSLTITGVRKTDAGIYRCLLDDGTTKGNAYLLLVNEKRSSPRNQTDTNYNEAPTIYKTLTIVLGIISSILLVVNVMLLYKLYCPTSKPLKGQFTPTATYHVQKSDDVTTENSVFLGNTESPSMVSHPVQESDTTENKSSNTRPF